MTDLILAHGFDRHAPAERITAPSPHRPPAPHAGRGRGPAWLGLVIPLLALAGLELAVRAGAVPAHLLPPPSEVAGALRALGAAELWRHVGASVARVAIGFGLGALLAVLVGAWVGLSPRAAALLDPSIQGLRAIPSLAWVPLLLLWMGIDEAPKITLIAIGAFFPVYLNLTAAIVHVDRRLVEVGRVHGLRGWGLVRHIFLPAALPELFTGLRGGLGLAWMFLVAAELIAATRGLGYLLSDGRETGRADIMLGAIALLGLLGKISDSALALIERRALHWHDGFGSTRA
jgi:sulfonate transport system permease protein